MISPLLSEWYIGLVPFPKTHRFRELFYRLRWRKAPMSRKERKQHSKAGLELMGRHYPPYDTHCGMIYIDKSLPPGDLLDTIIHESLHACFHDLDENAVTEASESITKLLQRIGIQVSFKGK